jgi:hypothetical protein
MNLLKHLFGSIHHHLNEMETRIMSAITDYAAKQTAFNTEVKADFQKLSDGIDALNAKITAFNNSPGTLSVDDQAALDGLVTDGQALTTQADTLANKVAAPPTVPAG